MLTMTSIIRVGQSKFVTAKIDEDSNERILGCIQTLSELQGRPEVNEVFLTDSRAAYTKMLEAQEVCSLWCNAMGLSLIACTIEMRCGKEGIRDRQRKDRTS